MQRERKEKKLYLDIYKRKTERRKEKEERRRMKIYGCVRYTDHNKFVDSYIYNQCVLRPCYLCFQYLSIFFCFLSLSIYIKK
jgi:hypothetical protein